MKGLTRLFPALLLGPVLTALADVDYTNPQLIETGKYIAIAADCVACHTHPETGRPFAGGLEMETPIGNIYSTNITPDKETGIGNYSFEAFDKAVRHGIGGKGYSLYPAMPFPSYSRLTDADVQAMYAYFMHGVEPVKQANLDNEIPWPLSMRWPLTVWRWLFAPEVKEFEPERQHDPVVARGAYLVEGLGHCGACHTPRGVFMQEKGLTASDKAFLSGGVSDDWNAKNLRGDALQGLGSWKQNELVQYLQTGRTDRTAVFGAMTLVIEHSTQYLSDSDLQAIAAYLKTLPALDENEKPHQYDETVAKALFEGDDSSTGAALYIDNCAACHRTDGQGYTRVFPALAGSSVVNGEDSLSLIHIVLNGGTLPATQKAPSAFTMPPFGWRLDDGQVTEIVNFIRTSWGNQGSTVTPHRVSEIREKVKPPTYGVVPGRTGPYTAN